MFLCKLSCIAGAITLAITSAQGQSYNEPVIHHFDGYPFGQYPSRVISDAAGNFYGTAYAGGLYDGGVVFKVDAAGNPTVLHNFTGGQDGCNPSAPLIADCRGTADHILRARQLQERGAARATG